VNGQTPVQLLQDAATFYTSPGASVATPQAGLAASLAARLRQHHSRIRAAVLAAPASQTGQTLASMAAALKRRPSMIGNATPSSTSSTANGGNLLTPNGSTTPQQPNTSPRNAHSSQQAPPHYIGAGGSATAERASRRARTEREAANAAMIAMMNGTNTSLLPSLRPRTGHGRSPRSHHHSPSTITSTSEWDS
jgi:hypothetical protein